MYIISVMQDYSADSRVVQYNADPRAMQDYNADPRVVQDLHSDYSADPRPGPKGLVI